jgi:hypothetical protein
MSPTPANTRTHIARFPRRRFRLLPTELGIWFWKRSISSWKSGIRVILFNQHTFGSFLATHERRGVIPAARPDVTTNFEIVRVRSNRKLKINATGVRRPVRRPPSPGSQPESAGDRSCPSDAWCRRGHRQKRAGLSEATGPAVRLRNAPGITVEDPSSRATERPR